MRLPANMSKSPLYREKSVLELRALKIPEAHRMSVITINNKLRWVASAAEWGAKHGYPAANYAEGLALPKTKRDSEHREPYTADEVLQAVCNRHHSLDQQLFRWLLLSLDRLPSNELLMTPQLIANMLGVRREGVTEAAGKLQAEGLIKTAGARSPSSTARGSRRACASATPW